MPSPWNACPPPISRKFLRPCWSQDRLNIELYSRLSRVSQRWYNWTLSFFMMTGVTCNQSQNQWYNILILAGIHIQAIYLWIPGIIHWMNFMNIHWTYVVIGTTSAGEWPHWELRWLTAGYSCSQADERHYNGSEIDVEAGYDCEVAEQIPQAWHQRLKH